MLSYYDVSALCVCDSFGTDEEAQSVAYPFPGFCDLKHTVVQRFSSAERTNERTTSSKPLLAVVQKFLSLTANLGLFSSSDLVLP